MSNAEIEKLSFEDALVELEQIVRQLETGQTSLDQSVQAYERGVALKGHCEKQLKQASLKIEKLTLSPDGQPTGTTDFDPDQ